MFWSRPNFLCYFLSLYFTFITMFDTHAVEAFTDNECMESSFNIHVAHPAKPFGLTQNTLTINKEKCEIKVHHERFKFFKDEWVIDICRGPIHIKKGTSSIEVLKREGPCKFEEYKNTPYCLEWKKMRQIIQDDGLIFAVGEKENLKDAHGKVFCSYLLLNKYLTDGMIFSGGNKLLDNTLRRDLTQYHDIGPEKMPIKKPNMEEVSPPQIPQKEDAEEIPTPDTLKF